MANEVESAVVMRRNLFDCVENAGPKTTWHYSRALEMIEKRDAAMKLAGALEALDKLEQRVAGFIKRNPEHAWSKGMPRSFQELRAEYSQPTKKGESDG